MTLTYFHMICRVACLAAGVSMLTACPGKEGETDSGTGTTTGDATTETSGTGTPTTGGSTTGATETGGTMSGTMSDSTTGQPTTGGTMGGTTTGDTTTAGTTEATTDTSAGSTTGVVPPELDASCMVACDKFFECVDPPPFPDIDSCKGECSAAPGDTAECLDAYVALNNCMGTLNCQQFNNAFMNEDFGPCTDEFDAMMMTCQGEVCEGFGGVGPDGCSIGQQCPEQPMEEYSCEGDTCTCLIDGQPTGMSCPAAGFCDMQFDAQAAAAFACCGFEF